MSGTARFVESPTFTVRLYMSGSLDVAQQYLRQECLREGLCVTIEPTRFIYTGGEETGFVVGLLNYPRFPTTESVLIDRAKVIALGLLSVTFQTSVLIVAREVTTWVTS